jgi:hypothetical protein
MDSTDNKLHLEKDAQEHAQPGVFNQESIYNESSSEFIPPKMSSSQSLQQKEEDSSVASPSSSPRSVHGFKWFLAAMSLYVGVLIYGLDGTIAADIQSSIIQQFNDVESLTWIGTGFPLGSLCFILPS